ncbi:MAG TPA: peptidoglycan-associated lipoprotein Pal [Rhodospirillales bacterium]|nr:peptidoglycan-associated lipoprotein Pal [Rhodospirillales bacterium]
MRFKILSLFAAVLLVSACETAPQGSASSDGDGDDDGGVYATGSYPSGGKKKIAIAAETTGTMMGTQEDLVVNVGDRVFFGFDKYALNSESRGILEKQAVWLNKYPHLSVALEGHADERGTREYNLALGERRANSVKDYLTGLGVSASRIRTISYGKERPVALGSNEAAWAQNRRSVTMVSGAGS